ncbi:MAG: hypothetical protein HOC09_29685 [Deltaproteobacteria bacterium]|nr:hypothetical protein [Deltaproteobacteria bacterium]
MLKNLFLTLFSPSRGLDFGDNLTPSIDDIKEIGESFKPLVEITAIVLAGLWSYRLFIKNRTEYPFAELSHSITHVNLGDGHNYLALTITMKNSGNVLLELLSGMVIVQQIRPLRDDLKNMIHNADHMHLREGNVPDLFHDRKSKITWREIGFRGLDWEKGEIKIEPGETEEFQYDFILDDGIQTVKILTYFKNIKMRRREIGWRLTDLYDLKGEKNGKRKSEDRS